MNDMTSDEEQRMRIIKVLLQFELYFF